MAVHSAPKPAAVLSYGGVVIDDRGRVLLRRPRGDFDGYVWTFPKGPAEPGETPAAAAARQAREETGWEVARPERLSGRFRGGTRYCEYFLFAPVASAGPPDPEQTQDLRWAEPDEADRLIAETRNERGRERDRAVLAAALSLSARLLGNDGLRRSRRPTRAEAEALLGFLSGFERPDREYVNWPAPEYEGGALVMPYPDYDPDVRDFVEQAGREPWCDFAYQPAGAEAMLAHDPLVASCDLDQLKTMLTYCVRGEKFCDGHWGAVLREGKVQSLLRRLAALRTALRG